MRVPICQYSVVSAAFTAADSVSILARPEGRALHGLSPGGIRINSFQSSPVPKDGRYTAMLCEAPPLPSFQSSPVPKDGRYSSPAEAVRAIMAFQSSPVPKDGRYVGAMRRLTALRKRFQSSPVPKDGRY